MQLIAKLIQLLPIQTGSGKNGEWKKQDIIVEAAGQYPKKVCVSIWGDKINEVQLQIGSILQIDFDIERREYNRVNGIPILKHGKSIYQSKILKTHRIIPLIQLILFQIS